MSTWNSRKIAVDSERYKWRVLAIGVTAYIFDAADFMILAMIIPAIVAEWNMSFATAGSIAMATLFGATIGSYLWGPIADKIGRRYTICLCVTIFSILSFCCGLSQSWEQLLALRFLAGIGLGGQWILGMSLISEFFPPHQRARATTAMQTAWPLGFSLVIVLNMLVVPLLGWRYLFFLGGLGVVLALSAFLFLPESPAWVKGRENRAKGIIGESTTTTQAIKWTDIFKGANGKVLFVCVGLCVCMNVAYWGTGTFIPAFLLKERGLELRGLTWFLLAMQAANILSYVIFGYVADKIGRRIVFMLGGVASAVSVVLYMLAPTHFLIFIAGMFFLFCQSIYWGPLGAAISEQFSTNVRGLGLSVSFGTGRVASALAPLVLGGLADRTSLAFAIGTMAVVFLGAAVFGYLLKETKDTIVVD